jgi:hypothetical protein
MHPQKQWIQSVIGQERYRLDMLTIGRDKLADYINYLNYLKSNSPIEHSIMVNKAYCTYIHAMLNSMEHNNIYIGELVIDSNDTIIVSYSSEIQNTMIEITRVNNRLENLKAHIQFLNDKLSRCSTDKDLDKLCTQMQELSVDRKN